MCFHIQAIETTKKYTFTRKHAIPGLSGSCLAGLHIFGALAGADVGAGDGAGAEDGAGSPWLGLVLGLVLGLKLGLGLKLLLGCWGWGEGCHFDICSTFCFMVPRPMANE